MAASAPATTRVGLARLAAAVLAAHPRVMATAGPGHRWQTHDAGQQIVGVVAVVEPSGRVEVALHVSVIWPPGPLDQVAEDLRALLVAEARTAGLEDRLGPIVVLFEDVVETTLVEEGG